MTETILATFLGGIVIGIIIGWYAFRAGYRSALKRMKWYYEDMIPTKDERR